MAQISKLTGREYHLFNYYGAPDAERVIVAMGSVCGCAQEVVDYLNAKGEKVGFLQVHLFRPFSVKHSDGRYAQDGARSIAVLDRVKESGSIGEPLYEDICAAYINEADRPADLRRPLRPVQQGHHPRPDQGRVRQPAAGRAARTTSPSASRTT